MIVSATTDLEMLFLPVLFSGLGPIKQTVSTMRPVRASDVFSELKVSRSQSIPRISSGVMEWINMAQVPRGIVVIGSRSKRAVTETHVQRPARDVRRMAGEVLERPQNKGAQIFMIFNQVGGKSGVHLSGIKAVVESGDFKTRRREGKAQEDHRPCLGDWSSGGIASGRPCRAARS